MFPPMNKSNRTPKTMPKTMANSVYSSSEMPGHIAFKRLEVIDRGKYRRRETVPELTSFIHKGLRVSVNSCIRELDRKRVRV